MSDKKIPDHGSSLVWSTEDSGKVTALLQKHGGDVDKSLKALFGHSCSYETALRLSGTLAVHFKLKPAEFMKKYLAGEKASFSEREPRPMQREPERYCRGYLHSTRRRSV